MRYSHHMVLCEIFRAWILEHILHQKLVFDNCWLLNYFSLCYIISTIINISQCYGLMEEYIYFNLAICVSFIVLYNVIVTLSLKRMFCE